MKVNEVNLKLTKYSNKTYILSNLKHCNAIPSSLGYRFLFKRNLLVRVPA